MVGSPRSSKPRGLKAIEILQPGIRNIQLDSIGHHPPSDSPLRNRVPQPPPPFLSSGYTSPEPSPTNSTEPSPTSSAEPSPPDSPQYPHYYLREVPPYFLRLPPRISQPSTPHVPLYPWVQAMYQPPAPQGQPQPLFPWARAQTGSLYQSPPTPPPQLPRPPSPPQQTDHERYLRNVIISFVIVDIFAIGFAVVG